MGITLTLLFDDKKKMTYLSHPPSSPPLLPPHDRRRTVPIRLRPDSLRHWGRGLHRLVARQAPPPARLHHQGNRQKPRSLTNSNTVYMRIITFFFCFPFLLN